MGLKIFGEDTLVLVLVKGEDDHENLVVHMYEKENFHISKDEDGNEIYECCMGNFETFTDMHNNHYTIRITGQDQMDWKLGNAVTLTGF